MNEKIWYEDIPFFLSNYSKYAEFIPEKRLNLTEQLNALMRFSIYFAIIHFIVKREIYIVFLVLFMGILTYVINNNYTKTEEVKETLLNKLNIDEEGECYKPTKNNPFMNVLFTDYKDFPNRPKACDLSNTSVNENVTKLFEEGTVRATDDIFNRSGSDRQFFSNPSTTIPNDITSFTKWCYKIPKTLKEEGLENYFTPYKK